MKILVTGCEGQIGYALRRALTPLGVVTGVSRADADLADESAVSKLLRQSQPDLIVNAAAYTAVDKAESEPELAWALNTRLPGQLARWSAEQDAELIHYSTDYVYSGAGNTPWREDDPTSPASVYGRTKCEGDEQVQAINPESVILRTAWVYGARGRNFMRTMLRLGTENDELTIVSDQIGAPTPAWLIAQVTAHVVYRSGINEPLKGLYHLTARGETSWWGFSSEIMHQARAAGVALRVDPANVYPIPTRDYPTPAPRPLNSRLDVSKLERTLAIRMPEWQDALALTLEDWMECETS